MNGLRELLEFYADAGLDWPVGETAVDHFAPPPARDAATAPQPSEARRPTRIDGEQPRPSQPPAAAPRPARAAVPDSARVAEARDLAGSARTLDELKAALAFFDGCNLKTMAKNLVFADGNPEADLMFVGGAPGSDDDVEGVPFMGPPGALLDRMLGAMGLDRKGAYLANVVPWRPPGNRQPTPMEIEICRPFVERQIELARPKVLVALGNVPAAVFTGQPGNVMRLRGTWRLWTTSAGATIPVMPTLHPEYLRQHPAHKKFAWRDLLEVKAKLRGD